MIQTIINIILIIVLSVLQVFSIAIVWGERQTLSKQNKDYKTLGVKFMKILYLLIFLFFANIILLFTFTIWYVIPLIISLLTFLMFYLPYKFQKID